MMSTSLNGNETLYLQDFYYDLVKAAGNVFFVTDETGHLTYVDVGVMAVLGFSPSDIIGKHFSELVHADWREKIVGFYTKQFEEKTLETLMEFEVQSNDGERRWVEQIVRLMVLDGKVTGCNGLMHDITRRKRAEDTARTIEQSYLLASENSGAIVFIVNQDAVLEYANPAMEVATGYSRNELIGMRVQKLIHTDHHEQLSGVLQLQSQEHPLNPRTEIRIIRKDGSICWLDVVANWGEIQGKPTLIGSALDISDRKKIEQQLKESQFFIEQINQTVPDLIYVFDLEERRVVYSNRSFGSSLGYTEDEILSMGKNALVQLLTPDEIEAYKVRIEKLKILGEGEIQESTFRMRHKDGGIRWMQLRATAFERDRDGQVTRTLGLTRDVTDQIKVQESARNSEEQLRKSLQYQRELNEINFELGDIESFEDMCKRVIELGQSRLGFDRIGLLLFDHKTETIIGTFGIDAQGQIRDERETGHPLSDEFQLISKTVRGRQRVRVREDCDLYDNWEVVGHGWNAMALMWKDDHVIGWLAADNLIHQEPLQEYQLELLGLLAISLEHFCVQKEAELKLRESNRRYDELVGNLPCVVYRTHQRPDGSGYFEFVSPRCEEITGIKPEKLFQDVDYWVEQIVPEDRPAYDALVKKVVNNPHLFEWEGQVLINGERRWRRVESHPNKLEDGSVIWDGIMTDVTDRRRSEEALRQSEERYRTIIEEQADMISRYTPDTRLTFVNEAQCRYFGRSREELIGVSFLKETPPAYHNMILEHIEQARVSHESFRHEHPVRVADGSTRWVEWTDTPMFDANGQLTMFQSLGRDIEERKRTEADRNDYISRLEIIRRVDLELTESLNYDHVLQIAVDAAIRISHASAGAIHLLEGDRLRVAHVIGKFPSSMVGTTVPLDKGIVGRVARRAIPELISDINLDPDYLPNVIETQAQMTLPLVSQDRLIGVLNVQTAQPNHFTRPMFDFLKVLAVRIASALDNAHLHHKTEQQVVELTTLYQQVSELEQLKTQMIRIAAHDLRNPLGVISGYIQMMQEELAPHFTERSHDQILAIKDSIVRIDKITRDILTLERIAAGGNLLAERVDLTQMVNDAFMQVKPQAVQKTLEYQLEKPDQPLYVQADRYLLPETFINLLTNAIKYTPEGGSIQVRLAIEDEQAVFTVKDTGFGIPKDQQEGLFQAFYRVKTKETKGIGGTGLGLHLVKAIIERHKGNMRFESDYGKGSTFGFELPVVESGAPHNKRHIAVRK